MDLGIRGRRAVVCGGSRGIGLAIASRLAAEGASLTLVARDAATLAVAAKELAAAHGMPVATVVADLSTPLGRTAVLAAVPDADILIAHAGTPQRSLAYQDLSRADWIEWMDAHCFFALELIRGYLPGMRARSFGRIVNVSANFIKFPQVNAGHSHAARLALAGAIASLVREVAPHNVTINSVLPGLIDTEALRGALRGRAAARGVPYETVLAEVVRSCPAERIGTPEELADLVVFLTAAQGGFVTGQNIALDGGAYPGLF